MRQRAKERAELERAAVDEGAGDVSTVLDGFSASRRFTRGATVELAP